MAYANVVIRENCADHGCWLWDWEVRRGPLPFPSTLVSVLRCDLSFRRLAFDLYKLGCHLVLLDIRSELVSAVTKELMATSRSLGLKTGAPPRVWTYTIDVTDTAAVQTLCKRIQKDVAPAHVSILVNNAGIVVGKDVLALTPAEIHRTFEVNVLAHFTMVQGFLRTMIDRSEGVIVTVASVMGLVGALLFGLALLHSQ
jgi:all-trans-retinol dehydrogenase (NAD+)